MREMIWERNTIFALIRILISPRRFLGRHRLHGLVRLLVESLFVTRMIRDEVERGTERMDDLFLGGGNGKRVGKEGRKEVLYTL